VPELPEVETVRRTLAPAVGAGVAEVWTSGLPLRRNRPVDRRALARATSGGVIEGIRRLGKYLLVDFRDRQHTLLVHLGMSGRLLLAAAGEPRPRHTHVAWQLVGAGAGRELRFVDPRRFGVVDLVARGHERDHPALALLGVDPLAEPLDGATLHRMTRASRQPLKTFLLDQRRVAGLGNIYACEALWEGRVRPGLRAHRLSAARADELARAITAVLEHALSRGGTSLRDFVNAVGSPGDYRGYLRVYDRAGKPCPRPACPAQIRRVVTQGRATFFCPSCQHS
jgi:formamidopyrimidine-DNA glycosylase